jgi:hypothetical protein
LPACLTIGDDDQLSFRFRMPRGNFLHKDRLGAADILDCLAGHWLRRKVDEVTGVTGSKSHPDFAVWLHATYAGSMAGAWIDDDDRRPCRIDRDVGRRNNAHKPVVDRPLQSPAVPYQSHWKAEHMRDFL